MDTIIQKDADILWWSREPELEDIMSKKGRKGKKRKRELKEQIAKMAKLLKKEKKHAKKIAEMNK